MDLETLAAARKANDNAGDNPGDDPEQPDRRPVVTIPAAAAPSTPTRAEAT